MANTHIIVTEESDAPEGSDPRGMRWYIATDHAAAIARAVVVVGYVPLGFDRPYMELLADEEQRGCPGPDGLLQVDVHLPDHRAQAARHTALDGAEACRLLGDRSCSLHSLGLVELGMGCDRPHNKKRHPIAYELFELFEPSAGPQKPAFYELLKQVCADCAVAW